MHIRKYIFMCTYAPDQSYFIQIFNCNKNYLASFKRFSMFMCTYASDQSRENYFYNLLVTFTRLYKLYLLYIMPQNNVQSSVKTGQFTLIQPINHLSRPNA